MCEENQTMLIAGVAFAALALFGAWCHWRVRREVRGRGRLRRATAVAVWTTYIAYTGAVAWVSWRGFWPLPFDKDVLRALGILIILSAAGWSLAGMWEFRSLARLSGRRADQLVQTGVYRWSRNPQNVGWGVALVGIALCGGSGAALLLTSVFWIAFRAYIPIEESLLERVYGDEWRRYREIAPRFFGRPRRANGSAAAKQVPSSSLREV
jgi:protein-S-isoprenylcysteine O-methyltransferase Ste14